MNIGKKIIIVGAGGFGREVVWTIQDCNKISRTYSIEGFLDDDESLTGKKIDGITNGAAAANKAVVLDGNLDIATFVAN